MPLEHTHGDAPMSSGGALSPTAMLLLRSEQPQRFLQPSATTATRTARKPSDASSSPGAHRHRSVGETDDDEAARPPTRTEEEEELPAAASLAYDIDSQEREEHATATDKAANAGNRYFRRSGSFSADDDAAARTFPPGRSESMSALAATASSQLRSASGDGGPAAGLRISSAQADDLAMKAILSPPHLRASSSTGKLADAKAASGGRSALTVLEVTGTNLLEQGAKLLFRGVSGGAGSSSSTAAAAAAAAAKASDNSSSIKNKQSSSGSIVEEDLAKLNNNVLVSHPTLPPPPFANMFACDNCREDIGTLLSKGRHHCRNCGGSFCADCTTKSVIVPFQVYLTRGEQRVCDGCYHRIKDFQSQAQSTQVTWSGLQPPPNDVFTDEFELLESEVPVTIYNCSLFMDFSPFYGHLFLTREHACFKGYKGHKIKIPYAKIVSLIKPQFYYINALQVKTRRKEKFFFAEFNGLRDLCFLRMDQLIRAYQEGKKHFVQVSPDDLVQQAMVRRKSYKLMVESASSGLAPKSSSFMSSSKKSDADNFLSGKSTVGYIDIDEEEEESADEGDDDSSSSRSRRTSRSVMDDDVEDKKSSSSDEEMFEPLPPDALLAKTTVLLDCELKADVKDVFDLLWNDGVGQDFLFGSMEKARDIDIVVGKWEAITSANEDAVNKGFVVSKEGGFTLHRAVQSQHPPRITFPGLPAYAMCKRVQRFRLDATSADGERWDRFVISDILRMERIPFSDYFEIETRWVFSRDGKNYCHVQAGLIVNFIKSTWFKSQIDSSTRTESKEVLESWAKEAIEHLITHKNLQRRGEGEMPCSPAVRAATAPSCSSANMTTSEVGSMRDEDTSGEPKSPRPETRSRRSKSQKSVAGEGEGSSSSSSAAGAVSGLGDGGVVASFYQLVEARSSPVVQLLVVLVLLYCLMLIRFQQNQLQQLTTTTNVLLERLLQQQEQQLSASRLSSSIGTAVGSAGEVSAHTICQHHIVEGASEALRRFFEDASGQAHERR